MLKLFTSFLFARYGRIRDIDLKTPNRPPAYAFGGRIAHHSLSFSLIQYSRSCHAVCSASCECRARISLLLSGIWES
jgi:hypothetical protein